MPPWIFPRNGQGHTLMLENLGHHQEANWAARKLLVKNGIQQGKVQEAQGSKVRIYPHVQTIMPLYLYLRKGTRNHLPLSSPHFSTSANTGLIRIKHGSVTFAPIHCRRCSIWPISGQAAGILPWTTHLEWWSLEFWNGWVVRTIFQWLPLNT